MEGVDQTISPRVLAVFASPPPQKKTFRVRFGMVFQWFFWMVWFWVLLFGVVFGHATVGEVFSLFPENKSFCLGLILLKTLLVESCSGMEPVSGNTIKRYHDRG